MCVFALFPYFILISYDSIKTRSCQESNDRVSFPHWPWKGFLKSKKYSVFGIQYTVYGILNTAYSILNTYVAC